METKMDKYMVEVKQRRIELDIARTFAIICVVLCHATEAIYSLDKPGWIKLSSQSRAFMLFSFTLGRIGVPIFLFLTGALILRKNFNTDDDVIKYYKKNLLPLIGVNAIWIIIYNVFLWINNRKYLVTVEMIIKEFLFLIKVPLPNMWYFPMIIGLYIALPFISKIVKNFSSKSLKIIMAIIFVCSFVLPMINKLFDIFGIKDSYNTVLNLSFLGGTYGLYAILGYYLDNNIEEDLAKNKWKDVIFFVGSAIVCYLITYWFQMFSYSNKSKSIYNVWYDFPFLLICASCIFKAFLNIDTSKINNKMSKFFTFISKTCLATFFLHMIIQKIIETYIKEWQIIMPLKVIALSIINFIICMIFNFVFCKIKVISKYVMLVKN